MTRITNSSHDDNNDIHRGVRLHAQVSGSPQFPPRGAVAFVTGGALLLDGVEIASTETAAVRTVRLHACPMACTVLLSRLTGSALGVAFRFGSVRPSQLFLLVTCRSRR